MLYCCLIITYDPDFFNYSFEAISLRMRYFCIVSVTLLLSACTNFLFYPVKSFPVTPDAAGVNYEDLFIDSFDGAKLHGWKLFAQGELKGSLLFFHGNGDNVSTQLPATYWLAKAGYDVYVFDYRGYGQSEGAVNLDEIILDMESMIAYTVNQLPEGDSLIVMGHSLGGAMSIYAVAHSEYKDRMKTLITVEAFSDYHDIAQEAMSKSWLFWLFQLPLSFTIDNSYRPLDAIGDISPVPVMILHSEEDQMIDILHAERLYEAANEPKSFKKIDGNHNNIFANPANRSVLIDYLTNLH